MKSYPSATSPEGQDGAMAQDSASDLERRLVRAERQLSEAWSGRRRRMRCCASLHAHPVNWSLYSSRCSQAQPASAKPSAALCCYSSEIKKGAADLDSSP